FQRLTFHRISASEWCCDTVTLIQINSRQSRRTKITLRRGCPSGAMDESCIALMERPQQSSPPNMVWIPSGTFRMGSDKHYQEEAPSHRVSVNGFWIDRTPVTNKQFRKFVNKTGYVTVAETPRPERLSGCAAAYAQGGVAGLHTAETSGRSAR